MTKVKRKYRIKWKNVFKLVVILSGICLLLLGTFRLFNYIFEYKKTSNILSDVKKNTIVEYVVDNDSTIIIETEDVKDKFSPYFIYIKQGMINLDFNKLRKKIPDVAGWIQIKNSGINYPIVKSSDKSFYKTHTFDKKENRFGAIYTNSPLDDTSILIEGNKTVFDLRFLYDDEWRSDNANFIVKFVTPEYTSIWQMVSVYKNKQNTDSAIPSDIGYNDFLNEIIEKSDINFKTSLSTNDKLLELSSSDGITLVSKLIKMMYL